MCTLHRCISLYREVGNGITEVLLHYLDSEEVLNKLKRTDELGCSNTGFGAENI